MDKFLRWLRDHVPLWVKRASTVIGPMGLLAALVIGIKDLGYISGPRWAEILAWAGAALVFVSVATIYFDQWRHESDVLAIQRETQDQILNAQSDAQKQVSDAQSESQLQLADSRREAQVSLAEFQRNAQVAVALPVLHDAYHALRDASYSIREDESEVDQYRHLIASLEHMAMAFSSITGAPCRMCVKELIASEDAPPEITLAGAKDERWFNVKTLYRHDGSYSEAKDGPTPLHRNSDFRQVWDPKNKARCFFAEDLDAQANYLNDHRDGADLHDYEYHSTIVWPIQKRMVGEEVDLIGYLCVDSLQKNVFQYNNDFYLGAAYADSLYMVLAMKRQKELAPALPTGQ